MSSALMKFSVARGQSGLLTLAAPDETALADISRGIAVLQILGAADIGQACVVQQGIVLAVEAVEGTDAMLCRVGRRPARPGRGVGKARQARPGAARRSADNRRRNHPHVHKAGLRGMAFEAGGTILANRSLMIEAANAEGVFLLGVEP